MDAIIAFFVSAGSFAREIGSIIRVGGAGLMLVGAPAVAISEHSAAPLLLIPGAYLAGAAIEWIGARIERLG